MSSYSSTSFLPLGGLSLALMEAPNFLRPRSGFVVEGDFLFFEIKNQIFYHSHLTSKRIAPFLPLWVNRRVSNADTMRFE